MSEQEVSTPVSGRGLELGHSSATPISIDTPTLMKREGNESFRPESSGELEVDDHVFDVQLSEVNFIFSVNQAVKFLQNVVTIEIMTIFMNISSNLQFQRK